ncbi:MAG: D-alanyl-D-alanine carboxypeptidase family protein [Pseudomonadota bacterium]
MTTSPFRSIRRARPGWVAILLLAVWLAPAVAPAPAGAAPYAALVMDARTGQVLHARSADRRLHPASLTKMMTLYMAIEAVKQGRLGLDQRVRVSSAAAKQPPSKIGLLAGQRVTVRHLMRAAAVKSANDAATALAEATVGGSVRDWARAANAKALALGMSSTSFRNPHGLTQSGHLSTARDMAVLSRRLFFDHPEYWSLFSRERTVAMGRTLRTTNRRFLGSYRGADGIKTGYTRAAGFNLAASAQRGDQHVIAVMFGGRSSAQRTQQMAKLMDMGFARSPRVAARIRPGPVATQLARAPLPEQRPQAPDTLLGRVAKAVTPSAAASTRVSTATRRAPRRSELPVSRPGKAVAESLTVAVEFPASRP